MRFFILSISLFALVSACDEDYSTFRAGKVPVVECSVKRVAGGPTKTLKAKMELLDDNVAGVSLEAFMAHYGFDLQPLEGSLEVFISEGNFVQDEVGIISCGEVPKKKGVFCKDDVIVDKNLGVDGADEEFVKAFEVSCKRL
jgi:hypothetical protein